MKAFLATCILTGAMLAGGCATKKYVRNTSAPIQAKVDQVGEQTTQNSSQINDTRNQVKQVDERAQSGISAATERASAADAHAGEAMGRANQADQKAGAADQKADQANQGVASLRSVIANIDDFKLQNTVAVPFAFNRSVLTKEAKADLDRLAGEVKSGKRYFIAVEGYTDSTGSKEYNTALSKKRADAVVEYLVGTGEVPIYRIHMIGLGEVRPVEDAATRAARAKNRRVEVKVFSADQVTAALGSNTPTTENSASRSQDQR
jgi:OmpA-OmpF porin, OOP family